MKKISTHTTLATFSSTIIGIGLIALLAYFVIKHQQHRHLKNEKAHSLDIAKKAILLPLWNYDEAYIAEIINSMIDEDLDTVIAVKISTPDNAHLYGKISKNFGHLTYKQLAQDESVEVLRDNIYYRNRNLGTIEVYFSTARLIASYKRLGALIMVITFAMAILLAFIMNFYLKKLLTNPLREIASDAKKARQGNYLVNFKTDYFGELNVVTEAFNETLSALNKRDKLLNEHNTRLEELVAKRTRELDNERVKNFQASRLATLGEMAGAIAHEINNPLTIIHGHSSRLRTALLEKNEPLLSEKARKIHETSERIAKIVRGLRAFARDGSSDPIRPCPIENFIEDLTSLCMARAKDKNINLSFDYDRQDTLFINITQFGQVLINLINNSIDAVEHAKEKWIKVKIEHSGNKTHITVTDSGMGIKEEHLPKLMDPFFSTKKFGTGNGMGLSLSQRIISQHGGEFFYNPHSPNTQFVVVIPKHEPVSSRKI